MFERFTDKARRVVVLAQEEARRLDHNYIGTEHLLLGLLSEGEGVAASALTRMGIDLARVRQEVETIIGRGQTPPTGHVPFTPRAKKVLDLSLREALQLSQNYIGTEHLLLGLIREGEGVAAQVLTKLGAELGSVRAQVIEALSDPRAGGSSRRTAHVALAVRAGQQPESPPPRCSTCERSLAETGASKMLDVPQDGGDGTVPVLFVYCKACGSAVGVKIQP